MKYSIIGIVLMLLVLGGLYVVTEGDSINLPTSSSAPVAPADNAQYNIKLD